MPKYFHTLFQLNRIREFDLENTGNLSLDLWSLAAEGSLLSRISKFGLNINREFAARTCSLATEGTQEFQPLKKNTLNYSTRNSVSVPNILSRCDYYMSKCNHTLSTFYPTIFSKETFDITKLTIIFAAHFVEKHLDIEIQ